MITLELIKRTVETFANVKDISVKDRTRPLPDLRYTYMALCRAFIVDLNKPSLAKIGLTVKRDHASVLHGYKQFDIFYKTPSFEGNEVYKKSLAFLLETAKNEVIPEHLQKENIINHYRVKHIVTSEKYRDVINSLRLKLNNYRNNELIDQITELDENQQKELAVKLDAFLRVSGVK